MTDATAGRTRVKICGLTTQTDRDAAVSAGADALGFITDVPVETPREVAVDQAATLVSGAPPFTTTVLVTMPDSVADAVTLQERVGADAVQVHSGLAPTELAQLGEGIDASVIAAVDATGDDIAAYADSADAVLVDSTDDQGGGGTGETHDWEQTRRLVEHTATPVILAGGLTPENVEAAVEAVDPFAVDTATGVEREGGRKDHDAVAAFVAGATGVSAR
jgi:phosphoribosylanthranilate isomerase